MKYDKMVAITQAESQRKMNIAKNTISDMLKNMERITVAELVKRTGLLEDFFIKMSLSEEKWMKQYIDRKQFLRIDIRLQWTENLKIQ
mgnify:FL=1